MRFSVPKAVARNLLEFAALFALWRAGLAAIERHWLSPAALHTGLLLLAGAKTLFFGIENIGQLRAASANNTPYHKFLLLMLMNVWQVITSFGLDFHLLHLIDRSSFDFIPPDLTPAAHVFEFFYFSALNFMFFGYGDITPQTVPAKVLTLAEISLAFVTVIFLLSDFISLKESLRPPRSEA
ncbi:MAG TPA: ion channel [Lacipirellulaceae bacterium]|nr:ion channel [Lacipirellulaceae bacterium]